MSRELGESAVAYRDAGAMRSDDLTTAIGLLLARSALSQMDPPTHSSYFMAIVTPGERPVAASVTVVPKASAWAAGSMISGYLLTLSTDCQDDKGDLPDIALDQISKSASTGGGCRTYGLPALTRDQAAGITFQR
jgi:hypothetical protein